MYEICIVAPKATISHENIKNTHAS